MVGPFLRHRSVVLSLLSLCDIRPVASTGALVVVSTAPLRRCAVAPLRLTAPRGATEVPRRTGSAWHAGQNGAGVVAVRGGDAELEAGWARSCSGREVATDAGHRIADCGEDPTEDHTQTHAPAMATKRVVVRNRWRRVTNYTRTPRCEDLLNC